MRLPNLDVALLAAHYLLAAARGDSSHDRSATLSPRHAARTRPATTRNDADRFGPLAASLPNAMDRATRAGLFTLPDGERQERDPALPTPCCPRERRHATPRGGRHARAAESAPPPDTPDMSTHATSAPSSPSTALGGRNAPPVPAIWTRMWDALPISQRADLARAAARAQRLEIPIPHSLTTVENENAALTQRWLSDPIDRPVRRVYPALPAYAQEGQRTDDVDLDRMLRATSTQRLEDAMRAAERLAWEVSPRALTAEQETAYQADRLADLFDLDRLCDSRRSDLSLLRTVHVVLRARFPRYRAPLRDAHAIAVAARLRQRCETRRDEDLPASQARIFAQEVAAELEAESFAARLIPWRAAPMANADPWFDGMAIRNAVGKNVTGLAMDLIRRQPGLAHDLVMQKDPACRLALPVRPRTLLSIATRQCHRLLETWVRKRLNDLRESTRFPLGTPPQSIDTILLRLAGAHGVRLSAGADFATVMRDFHRLCAAWRAAPAYWIPPTLAAALHLAHATEDRATLIATAAEARENQAIDRFHERLAAYADPAGNREPQRLRELHAPPPHPLAANRTDALPPSNEARQDEKAQRSAVPSQGATTREFVQSLLVLPCWPMHVGETLARGEPREILSLLPFVVPAYDIEEGIRHGNETRALRGAFQFGADLLMTWLGGRVEASLALPAALPLVENGERATLGMLHRGLETLGDARALSLPLTERVSVEPAIPMVTLADTDLPLRYRPLASRARDGEIVPVELPNVPRAGLVHLPRENRVIPVGLAGDVIWELDWNGHIVAPMSDARLGELKPKIRTELRHPAASAEPADTATIANGVTVTSTTRWLDAHATAPPTRGANSNSFAATVLTDLMTIDEENGEQLRIFQELGLAYRRSETFRLLARGAALRTNPSPLRFDIRSEAIPAYAPAEHVITLPPADELAEIEYLGATGAVHFNPKDVWIHEVVHAMTLLTDPPPALAATHRGPVVYLTDRILYEINRPAPERIAYAVPATRARTLGKTDLKHTAERVIRENLMLDAQLARRTPISPDTLVRGTPVGQRATVLAAKRIEESIVHASSASRTPRIPFPDELVARLHGDTFLASEHSSAHLRLLRHFVEHARYLYDGSAWARKFLDAWLERDPTTRWTLHRFSRILAEREGTPCRVDTSYRRIELSLASSFAYLSPTGLKPYTMQRRVATLLAELGLPARTRTANAIDIDTERGAAVYVENKLLGLADDSEDRRIAARIWRDRPPNPPAADIPVNPTLARRAADDEDRFLASVCIRETDNTCVCS
ncbi:PipA/GogA/GtgA family type III secretion system effector [Robbsia sp. Bb-Pol-6]|uniref:PipA/GogA/GtgA family type III secretion system effector n=1 Tax=Robbsia betulipollinis TaxID=2981849 RepID=A0ABT3ZK87_9BURK|nr:PipA/GogA/GtgA family type III secretion system effector [Robbsia betulipollinis]MCY0386939.1 PipA/GogA/GtgA family type III secretion system effector [Robbsia betulipollinis]